MKTYNIKREQFLPATMDDAWEFFSSPENLAKITPSRLQFRILSKSGGSAMYEGQIIRYKIKVLPGIVTGWVTEIVQVEKPYRFTDIQRSGPYALWQHQHTFKPADGGVQMIDEVTYAIPFGWLGRFAHLIFVRRELNTIFDYRFSVLRKHFAEKRVSAV
jgi:ligand-binding SRPBCC domain-containing protein